MEWWQALDRAVLDGIQAFRCDFLDAVMPVVSFLGNGGILWIAIGLLLLWRPRYRRTGVAILGGLILGVLLCNGILKPLVARPRPFEQAEILLLIAAPNDFSFPSGHAVSSFIAATALFCGCRRWGIPALFVAATIAFSRLYLYVHYPSDVLLGALLGVGLGLAAYALARVCLRRYPKLLR